MATTGTGWSGAELAGFVRREEEQLLRAAVLVRGDVGRARGLVEDAFVVVGRRWPAAVEEDPVGTVRRSLFRSLLADCRGGAAAAEAAQALCRLPDDEDGWTVGPPSVESARVRAEAARALAELTPRERMVLVLLAVDGVTVGEAARTLRMLPRTVRAEARSALERLGAALPGRHLESGRADSLAVREVLEAALGRLPAPDLAAAVEDRVRQRRRVVRRRGLLLATGVLGAGAVGALGVRQLDAPDGPRELREGDPHLGSTDLGGVVVHPAPAPAAEASLPEHPRRAELPVPDPIGPGDPSLVSPVPRGGTDALVAAVYLVRGGGGRFVPVVRVTGDPPVRWSFDAAEVVGEERGYPLVTPDTVTVDRRRVVLPTVARVLVLDLPTGRVDDIGVRDPTLRSAGWASDGTTVVVHGRDDAWLVEPGTGEVTRATGPVAPGRHQLAWSAGATVVRTAAPDGRIESMEPVAGPPVVPFGPSASTPDGWVAAPVFLPGRFQDELGRGQGVAVLQIGHGSRLHVLAAEVPAGTALLRYRVLGWAPPATVLLESRSPAGPDGAPVLRVLAWDVPGAALWQVGTVDGVGGTGSWFTGRWGV